MSTVNVDRDELREIVRQAAAICCNWTIEPKIADDSAIDTADHVIETLRQRGRVHYDVESKAGHDENDHRRARRTTRYRLGGDSPRHGMGARVNGRRGHSGN